jgi:esterase/lipase superfamily enzyme
MHIGYHSWWSPHLKQIMELKVYGSSGKPMLVFPTQEGRYFEFEDFGMVEVCKPYIESGRLQIYTVDSIDSQTWTHPHLSVPERVNRYQEYEQYIIKEVFPFACENNPNHPERILTTGCSMGAYHSANFFFRHPELFDSLLAISGVYRLKLFIGDYMDEKVYYHTPLAFLRGLKDQNTLNLFRQSQIIISVGQGAWEDPMLEDTRQLEHLLRIKEIPAWIDYWGHDVNHDWPWWRKKMSYFLMHLKI